MRPLKSIETHEPQLERLKVWLRGGSLSLQPGLCSVWHTESKHFVMEQTNQFRLYLPTTKSYLPILCL